MRSSCWKEWDSKVVFSDKPSSSDSGKKLLNGANANCNFCTEGGRGQGGEKRENWTITHLVNKNQCSQTTLLTAHLHLPSLLALINTGSHLIKAVQFQKPILRVWHFKESEKATWIFISYHSTRTSGAPGEPGWEVSGWGWVGGGFYSCLKHVCTFSRSSTLFLRLCTSSVTFSAGLSLPPAGNQTNTEIYIRGEG